MKKTINLVFAILVSSIVFFSSSCSTGDKENPSGSDSLTTAVDTSLEAINKKLAEDPNNPILLHQRAKYFIERKRFEDALADMQNAIKIDSSKSEYFVTMADISIAANRSFNAKIFLERAIAIDPNNDKASLRLAELNFLVRKYPESLEILNGLLKKDKGNTTAWLMRGFIFKENGDTNQAVSDFRSAVEADADFYDAHMQLGMIFQLRNDPISEGYFTNALRVRPKSEEALYGRGLWYQEHGKYDQAIKDYTAILQINPKNKIAHFNLGYVHQIYLKVYAEAVKHYSRAIESDPQYAEAYFNRGLCFELLGNLQSAQADFKTAMVHRPGYRLAEEGLSRVSK
ncbi:MAG: tetratricopeptide repeat protein [Bacteroidota bacterium]|jgi:tetratricopeptide (TPR) repeat protein